MQDIVPRHLETIWYQAWKKFFFFCIRKQKDKNSMSCWRLKQSQLVSCDTSYSTFQVTLNMKFKVSLENTSWNFNCCCKNATLQQFWLWNFWRKNIIVTWIYLYSIWWNSKPPFSPCFNRQFNFYLLAWHQVLLPCLHSTTKTLKNKYYWNSPCCQLFLQQQVHYLPSWVYHNWF